MDPHHFDADPDPRSTFHFDADPNPDPYPTPFIFLLTVIGVIIFQYCRQLKGIDNEKRGFLKVVAFDRSPFKLFTLRFSNKSVQAPSCERPKTAL